MVQAVNFKWAQGEDLNIRLIYKEGVNIAKALAVPLASNYAVRMAIVVPQTNEVVYTFDSEVTAGSLGSGENRQPNINIFLPRSLTLTGGAIYSKMSSVPSFSYDLFLRNKVSDVQVKILRGSITIEKSNTLWA